MNCKKEGTLLADINALIGYRLGDAVKVVQENGFKIEDISITAPPKLEISGYDDSFRVLRIHSMGNNRLAVLVCKPL